MNAPNNHNKTGTWVKRMVSYRQDFMSINGTYPTCNLCGFPQIGINQQTFYCPGCGAKMSNPDDMGQITESSWYIGKLVLE